MYKIRNVLNATELFTLKWLILCYVKLTSIKREREENVRPKERHTEQDRQTETMRDKLTEREEDSMRETQAGR